MLETNSLSMSYLLCLCRAAAARDPCPCWGGSVHSSPLALGPWGEEDADAVALRAGLARLPVHSAAAWGRTCQHWSSLQLLLALLEVGEL